MIKQEVATDQQVKDYENFFAGRYTIINERNRKEQLLPEESAPQAIQDSGIIAVQEAIFQTIVQTSGWLLLSDALSVLDGVEKSIEDTLNTEISGWEMEISSLRNKIDEYKSRSDSAREKVDSVRRSIDKQKELLLEGFSAGVDAFTEGAKERIQDEIELLAQSRASEQDTKNTQIIQETLSDVDYESGWQLFFRVTAEITSEIITKFVPVFGKKLAKVFRVGSSLFEDLLGSVPQAVKPPSTQSTTSFNPYIIQSSTQEEALKTKEVINNFCAPHIQSWWVDTQDRLIREGTKIREDLVAVIQSDIQAISNELSSYLGDALQVEININTIQFPSFEFKGIDTQVRYQQEVYKRSNIEKRTRSRCCDSDEVYYVDIPVEESRTFYVIDLRDTARLIKSKLDEQAAINKALLHRVIKKQVDEDFRKAERQVLDYINKFQAEFDRLLTKRMKYDAESPQVLESLRGYSASLHPYRQEIEDIRQSLELWKPTQPNS